MNSHPFQHLTGVVCGFGVILAWPIQAVGSITGFGPNGSGWTLNGSVTPPSITNDVLNITDSGGYNQARSAFFNAPQDTRAFRASFIYQDFTPPTAGSSNPANGFVFVLQNQSPNAIGGPGGALGYAGIAPAAGIAFNVDNAQVVGTGYASWVVAGEGGNAYSAVSPVDLTSGDPITVTLTYDGTTLHEDLIDPITQAKFSTSYTIDLPTVLGANAAYVGFTGGTGKGAADQRISSFSFFPGLPNLSQATSGLLDIPYLPGDSLTPTITIENKTCAVGSQASGAFHVGFYWADSPRATAATRVKEVYVGGCPANGRVSINPGIPIPITTVSGIYYFGFKIDDANEVLECNESDNGTFWWIVAVLDPPPPTPISPAVLNPSNGHSYYLLDYSSWAAAETAAIAMGGHLTTIRSDAEQGWLYRTFSHFGGVNRNLWIGLYDPDPFHNSPNSQTRKGEFVWTSGEPVTYSRWNSGEPNNANAGEYFVHMWLPGYSISGFWNDNANDPSDNSAAFPFNGVVEVGANAPSAIISVPSELVFGNVPVGEVATASVTITNSGNAMMTVHKMTYPPGFSGNWPGGTIAPGSGQTVTVSFAPSALLTYGGSIAIDSDAASGSGSIAVSGTGISPRVIAISEIASFGTVPVGSAATASMVVSNLGAATLTVKSIDYPPGFSGNWLGGAILSGGAQTVIVTFTPALTTTYEGNITIDSDATSGDASIYVSGRGTNVTTRIITVSGKTSFGNVSPGAVAATTLTLSNSGSAPLTVSRIDFPDGFVGNWAGGVIPVGGTQPLTVIFAPTRIGAYNGTITITSDATEGSGTVELSGAGLPRRVIELSGNLAFGTVAIGRSNSSSLVIANSGSETLTVNSISYPAGFSGDWTGGPIASQASQTVTVTFAPLVATNYTGNVLVSSDAEAGAGTVPVSGTGVTPPTLALTGKLAFGKVTVGSSARGTLTISNASSAVLTVTNISYPTGFNGDWPGGPITPGNAYSVTVTFSPTDAIEYDGVIAVLTDSIGESTIPISGEGQAQIRVATPSGAADNGNFRLLVSGPSEVVLVLEYSSDLSTWNELAIIPNSSGTGDYTDNTLKGVVRRFYRIKER